MAEPKRAKIGILGVNGSGKSSLIKILAGVDDEYEGEARPLAGNVVGYLPQEPQLDETKTVKENVYEYIADKKDALDHFLEYEDRLAQGDELTEEEVEYYNYVKGRVEDEGLRDLDRKVAVSMNALRCPPPDLPVTNLSGVRNSMS
jgi:ATPase subunit of ABC transporter with duplicated ATPase domains